MRLRTKLTVALVALAAAATVSIGTIAYVATSHQLSTEIDDSLRDVATYAATQGRGNPRGDDDDNRSSGRSQTVLVQYLGSDGSVLTAPTGYSVPVDDSDKAIAAGNRSRAVYRDVTVSGQSYRMLTTHEDRGGAIQVLRPLSERNDLLSTLRLEIGAAALIVIAAAAETGWLLARQITRRLTDLAAAAGLVAETGRLDVTIPDTGQDEVAQVAGSFGRMLDALHQSELAQRRLVQDAGHELRTPLTSLRTNVEVLARYTDLPAAQRATAIADLQSETRELSSLVNELVELSSGDSPAPTFEPVAVADIVRRVAERATRRTGREVVIDVDDSVVLGNRTALERAVSNLVDNAMKFSPSKAPIELTLSDGRVEVRDHGLGIATDDLPRIFDRFYRADDARNLPGSGLGLAIVHDVAVSHGGSVFAANRVGGGATIGFMLPMDDGPVHTVV